MNDDFSGLLRGPDGKLSIRRILGTLSIVAGIAAEIMATLGNGDWTRFIGGGACLLAGFLLFGWVTVQNITDAMKAVKKET